MTKKKPPNPGSDEALYLGCSCPVLDNCHGQGSYLYGKGKFWISKNCPIHGEKIKKENKNGNLHHRHEKP